MRAWYAVRRLLGATICVGINCCMRERRISNVKGTLKMELPNGVVADCLLVPMLLQDTFVPKQAGCVSSRLWMKPGRWDFIPMLHRQFWTLHPITFQCWRRVPNHPPHLQLLMEKTMWILSIQKRQSTHRRPRSSRPNRVTSPHWPASSSTANKNYCLADTIFSTIFNTIFNHHYQSYSPSFYSIIIHYSILIII